jgi:hypothetical protein
MASLPYPKKTESTKGEKAAYEAFNAVDKLVSKPVMGSDGASRWQHFRADNKQIYELAHRPSVAPVAPLKVSDRKAGFRSWNEERKNEVEVRTKAGDAALNAGYTNFQHKNSETAEEVARNKHEKQVRKRVRPEEEPYYIKPADSDDGVTFQGHKFDYIFTTKDKKTGYYWDGMDSVKKLDQGDSHADTSIHIKNKQENASSNRAPTETATETNSAPKKKKRKKAKQAVIIDDPNNPMEQVAAAIQRRQLAATSATSGGGGGGDVAWETALDPTSGKTYYFCRATGERKWEKPQPEALALPLPLGWQSAKDPNTGKEYFYHAATAETRWERP